MDSPLETRLERHRLQRLSLALLGAGIIAVIPAAVLLAGEPQMPPAARQIQTRPADPPQPSRCPVRSRLVAR